MERSLMNFESSRGTRQGSLFQATFSCFVLLMFPTNLFMSVDTIVGPQRGRVCIE